MLNVVTHRTGSCRLLRGRNALSSLRKVCSSLMTCRPTAESGLNRRLSISDSWRSRRPLPSVPIYANLSIHVENNLSRQRRSVDKDDSSQQSVLSSLKARNRLFAHRNFAARRSPSARKAGQLLTGALQQLSRRVPSRERNPCSPYDVAFVDVRHHTPRRACDIRRGRALR